MSRPVSEPPAASRDARGGSLVLVLVALGVFVAADDQTSIVALLPPIINELGIAVDDFYQSSWVVNGYLLGYLVSLPLLGRVADVYGRGRVFVATLAVFMLGSVLVALAPNYASLVAARALQAVGGGGVVPVAMAIVVDELPPAKRALGLGAIAAASEAGALLGPLWGGGIAELLGWRWVFWINVPMTLPLVLLGWRVVGNARRAADPRIDWAGGALLMAGLAVLTVALVDDPIERRPLVATLALLALAGAFGAAFAWHEARTATPLVRLGIFRQRPVWAANLASLLVGGGLITALIGVPLFVNIVLVESALDGGVTLMRLTAAVPLGALAGGWLAGRLGLGPTAVLGMLLAAAGFGGLQAWDRELSEVLRSVPQVLAGLGFGLVIAPLGAAVLQRVSEDERATASAWLTLCRVVGMLAGAALLTSNGLGRFYARASGAAFDSPEFERLVIEAQVVTFREVFVAAAVVMLIAAVVAAFLGRTRAASDDAWWMAG